MPENIKMKIHAYIFTVITTLLIASCGGGGGGGADVPPSTTSGKVMDGYLKDAFVFLDLNKDGIYNTGEPQTRTDNEGNYTLVATADQIRNHAIIAVAISGTTVDSDNPNSTITQQYSLTAPIGKSGVISPITTLVASKMSAENLSLAAAEIAVKTDLSLPNIDLYKDYIAEKKMDNSYQQVHNIAAATAEILKSVEQTNAAAKTLNEKLVAVNSNFTSNDFLGKVSIIKSAADANAAASIGAANTSNAVAQSLLQRILNSIPTLFAVFVVIS